MANLLTVECVRSIEKNGTWRGFSKTEVYKGGELYATFPAEQRQPKFGTKTIIINCWMYASNWVRKNN